MKIKLLFFILLLAIISCNSLTPEEKEIKATLGKSVETGMFSFVQEGNSFIPYSEFRRRYRHISLVYLEDGCRPCFPKYTEWQTRMDTLDLNHDFTVLFVINGMSFDGFLSNLLESNPEYDLSKDRFHVIMDSEQQFLDANRDIPRQIFDKSLLIDKENKIKKQPKAIKNPFIVRWTGRFSIDAPYVFNLVVYIKDTPGFIDKIPFMHYFLPLMHYFEPFITKNLPLMHLGQIPCWIANGINISLL